MEYEVQLAPMDKAIVTPQGFFEPLCNSCSSPDCTNPIQDKPVSIVGQIKKNRLYVMNENMVKQVIACKGYVGDAAIHPLEGPNSMGSPSTI